MKRRKSQAKAMIQAYGRALHFLHTRKEQTRAIFARYTKINDQGMLDGSIKYGQDFLEKIPFVKPAAFQVTLDEVARTNPKAKQAKPQQFYDNSLVQEVVDEGFFAKLRGKKSLRLDAFPWFQPCQAFIPFRIEIQPVRINGIHCVHQAAERG